jgi:microcompartment protein CcmL/EutN
MAFPTAISFHGVAPSDLLRAEVIERARLLENVLGDVLACRVVVEADARHSRRGCHYGVHVRVAMPCHEIEAGGRPVSDAQHQDPYLTLAETFEVLLERMHEFVRRRCLECEHYRGGHARASTR